MGPAFQHLAGDVDDVRAGNADHVPSGAGLPVRDIGLAPILAGEFRGGDGVPHLLGRAGDVGGVDEFGLCLGLGHWSFSSACMRLWSAWSRSCSYLPIQRM